MSISIYFNLLTRLHAFQWTERHAALAVLVQVLLLQKVHIRDAETLGARIVALVREPLIGIGIAITALVRFFARMIVAACARAPESSGWRFRNANINCELRKCPQTSLHRRQNPPDYSRRTM